MIKVAVSLQAGSPADPAQVIAELNNTMHRVAHGQFTTAGFLFLDMQTRVGTYAAAGHPPLLLWKQATHTLREFSENGLLLGVFPEREYVNTRFEISSGDRLIMCTDGVWEAENEAEETFGDARLRDFIKGYGHLTANVIATALLAEVNDWSTIRRVRKQADDITIVVFGVN